MILYYDDKDNIIVIITKKSKMNKGKYLLYTFSEIFNDIDSYIIVFCYAYRLDIYNNIYYTCR